MLSFFCSSRAPKGGRLATVLVACGRRLAVRVDVLDGLLDGAVARLLPWESGVREDTGVGVRGARVVTAVVAVVVALVVVGARERGVEGSGHVGKGLAGGEVLGHLGEGLVWLAEIGEGAGAAGGDDLGAADGDVEVGDVLGVDFSTGADDLVVQVLLEVGLDILGLERLELAVVDLALEAGGQGDRAAGHKWVGGVSAASLHATEDTVSTNVVRAVSKVLLWVVVVLGLLVAADRSGVSRGN